MRYAITSDLHLRADAPERLENLEHVLKLLESKNIGELIIAGDLFDHGYAGYHTLDGLLKRYPCIRVTALAGNHDPGISGGQFTASNIRVIDGPLIEQNRKGELLFVFLPYVSGSSMGTVMEETELARTVGRTPWILFSHGDYGPRQRALSGNEDGYFPLTRGDLERTRPSRVILGHIHKPSAAEPGVVYPGSPFPLDITETGPRRILILDRSDGTLNTLSLPFAPCNFIEDIFLFPDGSEADRITASLDAVAARPGLPAAGTVRIRVRLSGGTSDRRAAEETVRRWFAEHGPEAESVDTSRLLFVAPGQSLSVLAGRIEKALADLSLSPRTVFGEEEVFRARIREHALRYVYRIRE